MSSIKLSPEHGVNPTLLKCPICAEDCGVALLGKLPDDAEAPREMLDTKPCEACVKYMEQGVILISVRDGETGQNPYRTGRMAVVKDEAVNVIVLNEAARVEILRKRCAFIEDRTWDVVGLPREGVKGN